MAYRYGVAIATGVEDLTRTICHQLHDRICKKKKKKKLIQMLHRGNKGEGPERERAGGFKVHCNVKPARAKNLSLINRELPTIYRG